MRPPKAQRLSAAERMIERGRYDEATAALDALLWEDPGLAQAWFLKGVCAYQTGRFPQAAANFRHASELEPGEAAPLSRLAATLVAMYQEQPARAAADRGAALAPEDAATLNSLGVVYSRTGGYPEALACFRQATAKAPRNVGYLYNLALAERDAGDLEAARTALHRILQLDPCFDKAYLALVELSRQTEKDNFVPRLEQLFAAAGSDAERRLTIGHALAKTHEDLGAYETSLDWLIKAKARRRETLRYSAEQDRVTFHAAADADFAAAGRGRTASSSEEPIFVIGLPRTGTTLIDRILSSHPAVASAGELWSLPVLVKQMTGTVSPRMIDAPTVAAAARLDPARLAEQYLAATRHLTGRTPRFIDKFPFNFFYAGLIHRMFPKARILCLRRDAMDSCLSNYRQMFSITSQTHDYGYDLLDTARYYVGFDRLVTHWRATLPPDRFTEVRYESLVADQEAETRRLIAFCGLEWDPRCLDFHENTQGVATASAAQVRDRLYSSSIGRWRRFGDRLAPMAALLREAGVVADSAP